MQDLLRLGFTSDAFRVSFFPVKHVLAKCLYEGSGAIHVRKETFSGYWESERKQWQIWSARLLWSSIGSCSSCPACTKSAIFFYEILQLHNPFSQSAKIYISPPLPDWENSLEHNWPSFWACAGLSRWKRFGLVDKLWFQTDRTFHFNDDISSSSWKRAIVTPKSVIVISFFGMPISISK